VYFARDEQFTTRHAKKRGHNADYEAGDHTRDELRRACQKGLARNGVMTEDQHYGDSDQKACNDFVERVGL
jgi:hypothetical protein